jgi:hypothetical protein
LNGNLAGMGRYPDTGYLTYTGLTSSTLTSSAITTLPYSYLNGTVVIRDEFSNIDTVHIIAVGSNTFTLATSPSILGGRGNGFFMMNHPNTLLTTTRIGSWYNKVSVDSVQMYFGSAGPSGQVVKIAVLDTGIYLSGLSNVTVENVDFDYFNQYNVFENGTTNILFDSCKVGHSGNNSVTANNAAHSTFRYDTLKNVNNNGAYATGSSSTYPVWQSCYLDSIGMWSGMGQTGASNAYTAIAWGYGFGTYKFNTFINIGYNGVYFNGDSTNVSFNFAQYYCMVKCDGAAYYTWNGSLPSYTYGINVNNNIGINSGSPGSGIVFDQTDIAFTEYIDNYQTKVTSSYNTGAYNASAGGFVHGANNTFTYNNWYGNSYTQFLASEVSSHAITGLVYKHNIHGINNTTSTLLSNYLLSFITPNNDLTTFCSSCDSNYYLYSAGITTNLYAKSSTNSGTLYTLSGWQSYLGYDLHSTYQSGALSFVYSVPGGRISLGYNAKDALGNIYPGIINLPSYGSSTLLQLPCSCIQVPVGSKILVQ